jgi:O-antigen/teichoic acid export membrane protein
VNLGRVFGAYIALLGAVILAKLIAVLSAAMLGRAIGSEGLGIYAAGIALVGYALIVTNFGLESVGVRLIASETAPAFGLARHIRQIRLITGAACALIWVAVVFYRDSSVSVYLPLGMATIAFALRDDWVLLALRRERDVAAIVVIREATFFGLVALAIMESKSAAVAAWSYLAAEFIAALVSQVLRARVVASGDNRATPSKRSLLHQGWPLFVMGTMTLTYTKIDIPLVAHFKGPGSAGIYFAAYSVLFGVLGLVAPFTRAIFPEMARTSAGGYAKSRDSIGNVALAAGTIGCLLAFGVRWLAAPMLQVLYGSDFVAGAEYLGILAASIGLTFGSSIFTQALIADGRQRAVAGVCAVVAFVNVAVNLLLIPTYGAGGAAATTVISEAVLLLGSLILFARSTNQVPLIWSGLWVFATFGLCWYFVAAQSRSSGASDLIGLCLFLVIQLPTAIRILGRVRNRGGVNRSAEPQGRLL